MDTHIKQAIEKLRSFGCIGVSEDRQPIYSAIETVCAAIEKLEQEIADLQHLHDSVEPSLSWMRSQCADHDKLKADLAEAKRKLVEVEKERDGLAACLIHSHRSNHGYKPDACSMCLIVQETLLQLLNEQSKKT